MSHSLANAMLSLAQVNLVVKMKSKNGNAIIHGVKLSHIPLTQHLVSCGEREREGGR